MASVRSGGARAAPSHGARLRPRRAGHAQARRTTGRATSGGKSALSPAAGGVSQALSTLGENPRGPLAPHAPLDAHSRAALAKITFTSVRN